MKKIINQLLPPLIGFGVNTLGLFAPIYSGKKGFDLFCSPRSGRLRPKDIDFLKSADHSEKLETNNGKVQTYLWNEGGKETILLVHGWESNAARWRFLISELIKKNFKIIAIDAPAHGNSDGKLFTIINYADAICVAVDRYQVDFITAHSVGGATSMYYLANASNALNIKKICLLGAPSRLKDAVQFFANFIGLTKRTFRNILTYFKKEYGLPMEEMSAAYFCPDIKIPVLIIHDEGDKIVKISNGKNIHQHLDNSELVVTQGLGHGLQDKQVFERLTDFFVGSKVEV